MQAIQSATRVAAHHMGMSQEVGAISPGLQADIIAVRGNPLEDVSLLREISFVLKEGEIVKAP